MIPRKKGVFQSDNQILIAAALIVLVISLTPIMAKELKLLQETRQQAFEETFKLQEERQYDPSYSQTEQLSGMVVGGAPSANDFGKLLNELGQTGRRLFKKLPGDAKQDWMRRFVESPGGLKDLTGPGHWKRFCDWVIVDQLSRSLKNHKGGEAYKLFGHSLKTKETRSLKRLYKLIQELCDDNQHGPPWAPSSEQAPETKTAPYQKGPGILSRPNFRPAPTIIPKEILPPSLDLPTTQPRPFRSPIPSWGTMVGTTLIAATIIGACIYYLPLLMLAALASSKSALVSAGVLALVAFVLQEESHAQEAVSSGNSAVLNELHPFAVDSLIQFAEKNPTEFIEWATEKYGSPHCNPTTSGGGRIRENAPITAVDLGVTQSLPTTPQRDASAICAASQTAYDDYVELIQVSGQRVDEGRVILRYPPELGINGIPEIIPDDPEQLIVVHEGNSVYTFVLLDCPTLEPIGVTVKFNIPNCPDYHFFLEWDCNTGEITVTQGPGDTGGPGTGNNCCDNPGSCTGGQFCGADCTCNPVTCTQVGTRKTSSPYEPGAEIPICGGTCPPGQGCRVVGTSCGCA